MVERCASTYQILLGVHIQQTAIFALHSITLYHDKEHGVSWCGYLCNSLSGATNIIRNTSVAATGEYDEDNWL